MARQGNLYVCTHGRPFRRVHATHMAKKPAAPRHFIRAWRKHRSKTLEQLAEMVGTTHATLSRIERGKLPYNQGQLEALAEALNCAPADLIMRDPTAPDAIWSIWEQVPVPEREQAARVLQTFTKKAASG
jgi:transcriptional regulator with XRE-family HTH domain